VVVAVEKGGETDATAVILTDMTPTRRPQVSGERDRGRGRDANALFKSMKMAKNEILHMSTCRMIF
jgi:hypothetical protein